MVQTAQKTNGAADPRFPFGIDPRYYGLSKLEYDRSIEHHRQMEHHAVMRDGILQQFTPLPPASPTGTAVEIEMRLAEYWRKHGHLYERMIKAWPLRSLSPLLPLIRYGRRKRRWRRFGATHVGLLSGKGWQVPNVKIEFN